MKKYKFLKIAIVLIGFFALSTTYGQCDTIASMCDKHIKKGFISDGQDYRSLLLDDEIAEFNMVLYGNSTYRFAACSGLTDGNLIFSVYDQQRNLLFTNKDYANAPYWDFKVSNTIDCVIEAQLDPNNLASGCAVLLVGFKQ